MLCFTTAFAASWYVLLDAVSYPSVNANILNLHYGFFLPNAANCSDA